MQHKNAKSRLRSASHVLPRRLDVLFQLPDRVLQRGSGVVHLVHDEDVFAHQIRHFERGKIQPLRAGYLGAGRFGGLGRIARREGFVQGETDGLDRNVGRVGSFEKGSGGRRWRRSAAGRTVEKRPSWGAPKYAGRNVTAAADGNYKVRLEVIENAIRGRLAQFMYLRFAALARPQPVATQVKCSFVVSSIGVGWGLEGGEWSGMVNCHLQGEKEGKMNRLRPMNGSNRPGCTSHRLFEPCSKNQRGGRDEKARQERGKRRKEKQKKRFKV